MKQSLIEDVQQRAREIWQEAGILNEEVSVSARTLSVEEAIGNPEGDDFPLQRGKEKLMEALFRQDRGQAFTDRFGDFRAPLGEIAEMKLENNFRRAIFVATLNAVQRSLGQTGNTIHCRDEGPSLCAPRFADHISKLYGRPKITLVGFQPKMIETLAERFELRVVDLDPDNIGSRKAGVTIEGPADSGAAVDQAELLVVTGSTLVNDTLADFLRTDRPTIFFGTTVAAAADLMGWNRFCCQSS
ncbi:Rossmann-like domain-containing protein [Desulfogranum mediterraneum]|uniref:Rossmann-like domain-containing protein n=1 Tax=Desulfogranum mediterraneum TaxID=160661 RepID=UPI00040FCC44|nr:DUF364 domain-containing protein [Desulfogranum mediterraneum]